MAKRKSLSKKIRFEVFKRDLFTCQYCGATPPNAVLEVDHIKPVASGGENQEDNLITACFDCNRGKGARELSEAPEALAKKIEVQKEKQEQLKQFEKMLSQKKALLTRKVNQLNEVFRVNTGNVFTDSFKKSTRLFFEKLPKQVVFDAMDIAICADLNADSTAKYFCGVCWNKIREVDHG
jgi:hypothetical protein